jgi:hypothetical protein
VPQIRSGHGDKVKGKFFPVFNKESRHESVLGEWRYSVGVEEKNSQPPPGIEPRSSDRAGRSQSLYRLRYPGSSSMDISPHFSVLYSIPCRQMPFDGPIPPSNKSHQMSKDS